MMFMGHQIEKTKLMTKDEVVDYLKTHGEDYSSLSVVRTRYEEEFGLDPVWNYQHCSDCFPGFFIVPVQEGFLSIPYDSVDSDDFEALVADSAELLSADDLQALLGLYRSYAEDMMNAMEEMIVIAKKEESQNA
jgi:hypothetical protein